LDKQKYVPSKEAEEILDGSRLMDDDFMTMFFDRNFAATELMVNIILKKKTVKIKDIQVQKLEKSPLPDGRKVWLDIFAVDSEGTNYDVEIQRAESGAGFKRARFLSSVLDSRMLKAGDPFSKLNESYMIFITETDVLNAGLPMYHVNRVIEELNAPFNDGNHIIYVNGAYKNDATDIGKLMHDFRCTKSSAMFFDVLKNGMHYFKETEGGREIMCKAVEEYGKKQKLEGRIEGRIEGKIEGKIETAKNLAAMGMSVSVISQALDATEASVREWLDIKTA